MPRPIKADVQTALGPYHQRIRKVVETAWGEWRALAALRSDSGLGPLMYSRTVANYVFDAIARAALREFAADTSIHIKVEAQTVKFYFSSGVLARFKKGDGNCLGQNIPTQSALAFADASSLLMDLPQSTAKVEFIWLANELQTQLEHVFVVARDGDQQLWQYEIESGAGAAIIPLPQFPIDPSDDVEDLVKPKVQGMPVKKSADE